MQNINESIEVFDIIPSTTDNLIPTLTFEEYLIKVFPLIITKKENPYKKIAMSWVWHTRKFGREQQLKRTLNTDWDALYASYYLKMRWTEATFIEIDDTGNEI